MNSRSIAGGEDSKLYDFYFNLYNFVDTAPAPWVREAQKLYPLKRDSYDHAIFISGLHRQLHTRYQNRLAREGRDAVLVAMPREFGLPIQPPGTTQLQSEMYLYKDQELIGCVRKSTEKFVNGVIYLVSEVLP